MIEQLSGEKPLALREAEFEQEMFRGGTMPLMTTEAFAEEITKRYPKGRGGGLFESIRHDLDTFEQNSEWNFAFSRLVPKDWIYPVLIEHDLRGAGAYDLVLAPTLAHAVATHPDKRLLADLAYWQPLSAAHFAEVIRQTREQPLMDIRQQRRWSQAELVERQKQKGTSEEVLEEAQKIADDPDYPGLNFRDYEQLDPNGQPEYVIRGLARELSIGKETTRLLVPDGMYFLQIRKRIERNDSTEIDDILSNLNEEKGNSVVGLIKRGAPAVGALIMAQVYHEFSSERGYEIAGEINRYDFAFPQIRESSEELREPLMEMARTIVGPYPRRANRDELRWREEKAAKHDELVYSFRNSNVIDGELLEGLAAAPDRKVYNTYRRAKEISRVLFGIKESEPLYDDFF